MAVAHSSASESHTGTTGSVSQTSFSWTHTQTGTPQGVLVFVHVANSTGNPVSTVTYGSVTLTRVSGGAAIDAAGEPGRTDLFFAGSGLASGNQTITVNRSNTTDEMYASAATVTALTATNITGIVLLEGDGTMAEQSVTDGSPGTNSLRYAAAYSGLNAPPTTGANSTLLTSIDFGNYTAAMVRETTAGQGARSVGFTTASDDRAAVHVAVRERFNRTDNAVVGAFTLTGPANTLSKGRSMVGERGSFALTGQPTDLRHNPKIDGGVGTFTHTGRPADLRIGHAIASDVGKFFLPERNLLLRSEEFNQAAWGKLGTNVFADQITAPDGTLTADRLIENSASSEHFAEEALPVVTGNRYVLSCYAKGDGSGRSLSLRTALQGVAAVSFNLANGTGSVNASSNLVSYGSTALANSWYRCWIVFDAIGTGTAVFRLQLYDNLGSFIYTGNGTASAYIWGAQLEQATAATDYDPTGPAGATNAALRQAYRLDGGVGAFTFTGRAADTLHNARLDGGTGAFSLIGNDATLTKATFKAITAETGAFTLTGNPATVRRGYALAAETGAFTTAGQPATLRHNPRIEANTGAFALSGGAPALLQGYYLSGGAGTFTETGQPATFRRTWAIDATSGTFNLTGNSASLTRVGAYELSGVVGSFTLSGTNADLAQSRLYGVTAGAFSVTGQPVSLQQGYVLNAGIGSFVISGSDAQLRRSPVFSVDAGVFALTGNDVTLSQSEALAAETGAFTLSSGAVELRRAPRLTVDSGSFSLTGNAAAFLIGRTFVAERGTYALTGQAALLQRGISVAADAGAFSLIGQPSTFRADRLVNFDSASYVFTGQSVNLSDTDLINAGVGTFALSGQVITLSKTRRRNVLIF